MTGRLDKGKRVGIMMSQEYVRYMTHVKQGRPRYTRAKWVKFTVRQADSLEDMAVTEGCSVSDLVRRATLRVFPALSERDPHEEGSLLN